MEQRKYMKWHKVLSILNLWNQLKTILTCLNTYTRHFFSDGTQYFAHLPKRKHLPNLCSWTFRGVLNLSWPYFNSHHFRYKRIRLKSSWISRSKPLPFIPQYPPCTLYLPTVIINLCQNVGKYSIHGASGYLNQSHKQPAPSKWPRRRGQGDPFYDALQQAQVECRVVGWLEKTWEPPKPVNMVNATWWTDASRNSESQNTREILVSQLLIEKFQS